MLTTGEHMKYLVYIQLNQIDHYKVATRIFTTDPAEATEYSLSGAKSALAALDKKQIKAGLYNEFGFIATDKVSA